MQRAAYQSEALLSICWNGEIMLVGFASEQIRSSAPSPNTANIGSMPVFDPAVWTLEMSSDLKLKARKAISRELRRIKFRLFLSFLFLYFEKLALKIRCSSLRILRNIARNLPEFVLYRH
jgi:hypothetical protein